MNSPSSRSLRSAGRSPIRCRGKSVRLHRLERPSVLLRCNKTRVNQSIGRARLTDADLGRVVNQRLIGIGQRIFSESHFLQKGLQINHWWAKLLPLAAFKASWTATIFSSCSAEFSRIDCFRVRLEQAFPPFRGARSGSPWQLPARWSGTCPQATGKTHRLIDVPRNSRQAERRTASGTDAPSIAPRPKSWVSVPLELGVTVASSSNSFSAR